MGQEHGQHTVAATISPDARLEDQLIRDLVETYPGTMTVLGELGLDLCCGGGHPLGEALDLHGLDRTVVLPRVASIIEESRQHTT